MELNRAIPFNDREAEQFYAYGFAHYNSGNWSEAADAFRVLCTRRPLEPRFWFGLGATLQEAGSYSDAVNAWAMAALLKKGDPYPHFHAAECYFSLREKREGIKALKEAESLLSQEDPLHSKIALLKEQWEKTYG